MNSGDRAASHRDQGSVLGFRFVKRFECLLKTPSGLALECLAFSIALTRPAGTRLQKKGGALSQR